MPNAVSLMLSRWLAMVIVCLLATGCAPEPDTRAAPSADARAAAGSVSAASPSAATGSDQSVWENGMAYATLRSRLLSRGWVPLPDAQCRANVVGDNYVALCAADTQQCEPCEALPELSACSGTGHCTMQFQGEGGKMLRVSTYGDVHRHTAVGEPEDLVVTALEPVSF